MTPEQFCYWLNGFCELSTQPPTIEQWAAIKQHLETVFHKVTPSAPGTIRRFNDFFVPHAQTGQPVETAVTTTYPPISDGGQATTQKLTWATTVQC